MKKSILIFAMMFSIIFTGCEFGELGMDNLNPVLDLNGNSVKTGGYMVSSNRTNGGVSFDVEQGGTRALSHVLFQFETCDGVYLSLSDVLEVRVNGQVWSAVTSTTGNGTDCHFENDNPFIKVDNLDAVENESVVTFDFVFVEGVMVKSGSGLLKGGQNCETLVFDSTCALVALSEGCSMSQGFYFASPVSAGWGQVTVGAVTLTEAEARALFTARKKTTGEKAFFQAATIKLSASTVSETASVWALVDVIDAELIHLGAVSKEAQTATGAIGNWVNENHCED
jgi:hypothetical protein